MGQTVSSCVWLVLLSAVSTGLARAALPSSGRRALLLCGAPRCSPLTLAGLWASTLWRLSSAAEEVGAQPALGDLLSVLWESLGLTVALFSGSHEDLSSCFPEWRHRFPLLPPVS